MTEPFSIEEAILQGDDCPKYTARDMQQAVAAERERWFATGKALLSAHDASLARVGQMMQERGLTSMRVPPESKAEFDAIAELRALVGPSV